MVVATTIGVSIVGRLLGAGIQRSGSLLFQKILRLGRIEAALKGVSKNSLVESAVHDFETIIGTYYGELNVELETFVRELERSGIINLMVESALLKRDVLSNQMLFTDLHERIINSGGNAEALFQRMMKSFTVTLEELCKDKILLEAVRLHRAELSSRIDRVDGMLSDLSKFLKKDKESLEDTQQTLLKIAKGLQSQYRTVRVETNKGPRSVEISRIYIPPKLSYRESQNSANRIASVLPLIARIPKAAPKAVQHDFASEQEARDGLTRVTYGDLRLSFSRVVVLGDPGGGKSTLCQFLCHDLTKQALASVQIEGGRQLNAQLQKFPIRVILRSFEKARTLQPQLGLFQYILRDLKNYVTAEDKELSAALLFLLSTGSAVLAFDGLDEILATAQRREFVDLVKAFCDQFPLCPVLVTSRLVGYDDANLSEEFEEFILGKFDDQEVQSYATKFLKVVGSHKERDAERRAQLFFKQTTSNAADLRRNPLLLGLMAWLFHMRGDV